MSHSAASRSKILRIFVGIIRNVRDAATAGVQNPPGNPPCTRLQVREVSSLRLAAMYFSTIQYIYSRATYRLLAQRAASVLRFSDLGLYPTHRPADSRHHTQNGIPGVYEPASQSRGSPAYAGIMPATNRVLLSERSITEYVPISQQLTYLSDGWFALRTGTRSFRPLSSLPGHLCNTSTSHTHRRRMWYAPTCLYSAFRTLASSRCHSFCRVVCLPDLIEYAPPRISSHICPIIGGVVGLIELSGTFCAIVCRKARPCHSYVCQKFAPPGYCVQLVAVCSRLARCFSNHRSHPAIGPTGTVSHGDVAPSPGSHYGTRTKGINICNNTAPSYW